MEKAIRFSRRNREKDFVLQTEDSIVRLTCSQIFYNFNLTEEEMQTIAAKNLGHSEIVNHDDPAFAGFGGLIFPVDMRIDDALDWEKEPLRKTGSTVRWNSGNKIQLCSSHLLVGSIIANLSFHP